MNKPVKIPPFLSEAFYKAMKSDKLKDYMEQAEQKIITRQLKRRYRKLKNHT